VYVPSFPFFSLLSSLSLHSPLIIFSFYSVPQSQEIIIGNVDRNCNWHHHLPRPRSRVDFLRFHAQTQAQRRRRPSIRGSHTLTQPHDRRHDAERWRVATTHSLCSHTASWRWSEEKWRKWRERKENVELEVVEKGRKEFASSRSEFACAVAADGAQGGRRR
jgi:hypothetical protein